MDRRVFREPVITGFLFVIGLEAQGCECASLGTLDRRRSHWLRLWYTAECRGIDWRQRANCLATTEIPLSHRRFLAVTRHKAIFDDRRHKRFI